MPDHAINSPAASELDSEAANNLLNQDEAPSPVEMPSADGGDLANRPTQPRFQIRAAINSLYNTSRTYQEVETVAPQPPAPPPPDPEELKRAAEVQALIAQGQNLARQGQVDKARQSFGEAIRRDPANSEAWTWLGGLWMEPHPQRASECLQRALELDPTNERARKGLAQANQCLTELEAAQAAQNQPPVEEAVEPSRTLVKIGLEEAVTTLRQSGVVADPETVPMGGARIRPAVEKGELKLPPPRRVKPVKPPMAPLKRSLLVLGFLGFLAALVTVVSLVQVILNEPLTPAQLTATAYPTRPPLTIDETFAAKMRVEIDHYNHYFVSARDLRQQVQTGKIVWETYRQNVRDLQNQIRTEKKTLDSLATSATGPLLTYYRDLQRVAAITGQAIDFTVSGVENTNPEDLEEGNRQFLQAAALLVEVNNGLNQASPIPTPVPTPTPPSSEAGSTPAPTPADSQAATTPGPATTPPVTTDLAGTPGITDQATTAPVQTTSAATTPGPGATTPPATPNTLVP